MADHYIYSPETIIKAYSLGLFPMADSHDSLDIKFYDPDRRALIPIDHSLGRAFIFRDGCNAVFAKRPMR